MALIGAHVLLYTSEPRAMGAVCRDVFRWKLVVDGDGRLVFALPPAALHPAEDPTSEIGRLRAPGERGL